MADRSPPITTGMHVTVLIHGDERTLAVERVAEGLVWISTRELGALQPGESVEIQIGVRGDARYSARGRVAIAMRDFAGLRLENDWDRMQAREYARVSIYGQRVEVEREESPDTEALPLIDLSAGGARVAEEKELIEGDHVVCRFSLGGADFELGARVVRVAAPEEGERRFVSLEFQGVRDSERSDLIGWVNAEQVRRRTELRERSRSAHRSSRSR